MELRIISWILGLFILVMAMTSAAKEQKKKSWRDKDIRDMTDADLEHLLEQWEENDEPLEPDELPEHLRPAPKIDVSKLDLKNPESVLKATKKGKSVMMFVNLDPSILEEQADITTRIWQTGLQNNHITVERYPIENKRYIFMFHDGAQAIESKNYLLQQPEIAHITIEGQTYYPPLSKGQNFIVDESLKKPSTEKSEL
ncbi:LDLR chaperone boca [Monomorium pharaonis]|uniref:LDLR chaperone boca n=1 Tax=Monomorium pharaonis TaxID=307658 RepID=UPI00063FC814|nr:LDLR chaperone boca [Monomorium pharaonis]XP_012540401.1 LDLR chaperone boca [Monomorium pharaonis]XP_028048257.1 LDLR chaperone boca [Monomorium pharaonis]XP_028048258.1 LDLR chaperone boca [Monomorium pharaonis]